MEIEIYLNGKKVREPKENEETIGKSANGLFGNDNSFMDTAFNTLNEALKRKNDRLLAAKEKKEHDINLRWNLLEMVSKTTNNVNTMISEAEKLYKYCTEGIEVEAKGCQNTCANTCNKDMD